MLKESVQNNFGFAFIVITEGVFYSMGLDISTVILIGEYSVSYLNQVI